MLTLTELKAKVASGEVESIIMGFPDMYGRMLGKRFDADFFLQSAAEDGTHACDYLLACDMEVSADEARAASYGRPVSCCHSRWVFNCSFLLLRSDGPHPRLRLRELGEGLW
jgi:hypothetical protein